MLEDIVFGYEFPCVIDLKIGTRQYGDDASDQKRYSQMQKCRQSTSEKMGIRLVGMQLYQIHNNKFVYVNKYKGRRLNRTKLCLILRNFFIAAGHERLCELIEQLKTLRVILKSALGFRFFSSSILIAYDGGIKSGDLNKEVKLDVSFNNVRDKNSLNESFENQSVSNTDDKHQDSSQSTIFDSEDEESSLSNLSFNDQVPDDNLFSVNAMLLNNFTNDSLLMKDTINSKLQSHLHESNNNCLKKSKILLKMIDFAHSTFNGFLDDKIYNGADDGYLLGIDSLIEIVISICKSENLKVK